MKLEDLVDKEPYRMVDDDRCKPSVVYLDAETNDFLDAQYEPRGIKANQITNHYKYNGTLYCWYRRTKEEQEIGGK